MHSLEELPCVQKMPSSNLDCMYVSDHPVSRARHYSYCMKACWMSLRATSHVKCMQSFYGTLKLLPVTLEKISLKPMRENCGIWYKMLRWDAFTLMLLEMFWGRGPFSAMSRFRRTSITPAAKTADAARIRPKTERKIRQLEPIDSCAIDFVFYSLQPSQIGGA